KAKCPTELQIVSQGRLFLQSCGPDRIVDLHGKEITRFRSPGGWGLRRGWSADGTRLLYDRYVRTVLTVQRFGEVFIAIATLGVGRARICPSVRWVHLQVRASSCGCCELVAALI